MLADAALITSLVTAIVLSAGVMGVGAAVLWGLRFCSNPFHFPALCCATGASVVIGVYATLVFGRPTFLLMPVICIAGLALLPGKRLELHGDQSTVASFPLSHRISAFLAAGVFAVLLCRWYYFGTTSDGLRLLPYPDVGYFATLVQSLGEAGQMSFWSGIFGARTAEAGGVGDAWYHWGTIWLASLAHGTFGMPAYEAYAGIAVPTGIVLAVLVFQDLCHRLTGWGQWACLVAAMVCLLFQHFGPVAELQVPIARTFGIAGLTNLSFPLISSTWRPLESVYFFAAVWAWLAGQKRWSWVMLLAGSVSAPHGFLAIFGTLSLFLAIAVLRRRWTEVKDAAVGLTASLLAYSAVNWLFDGGLPRSAAAQSLSITLTQVIAAVKDSALGMVTMLLLAGLIIPGLLHLVVGKKCEDPQSRLTALGWAAMAALICGVLGYHGLTLLGFDGGDAGHFPAYLRSVIAIPIAALGTLRLAARGRSSARRLAFAVIGISLILSGIDLYAMRHKNLNRYQPVPSHAVAQLKDKLRGSKFGYFATFDRNWWIPMETSLAAVLETTCVRLNPIPNVDNNIPGRRYGSDQPFRLVPRMPDETDEDWASRFAWELGIDYILETAQYPIPEGAKKHWVLSTDVSGYRLYVPSHSATQEK